MQENTQDNIAADFFRFDTAVQRLGLRGVYLTLHGLNNTARPPGLDQYLDNLIAELFERYSVVDLAADPVLAGYRTLHERIGRSNKRFPAASETLIRLLLRLKKLPRINPLVDIYNAVSLETRLALGAHDIRFLCGGAELRLSSGSERFVPLGQAEAEPVQAGEYGYFDRSGEMICRLEHKQVEKTKVTAETTDCFYVLQGNEATTEEKLEAAADLLTELTTTFCGGGPGRRWQV